jgi:hypothetical protein
MLAAVLQGLSARTGDRRVTRCWNHHTHLDCCFGILAADDEPIDAMPRTSTGKFWRVRLRV